MTGRELKATIFQYLKSRGWENLRPGEYYAWDKRDPDDTRTDRQPQHFCWHAALAVQIAADEGVPIKLPAGAFEVIEGGRR